MNLESASIISNISSRFTLAQFIYLLPLKFHRPFIPIGNLIIPKQIRTCSRQKINTISALFKNVREKIQ